MKTPEDVLREAAVLEHERRQMNADFVRRIAAVRGSGVAVPVVPVVQQVPAAPAHPLEVLALQLMATIRTQLAAAVPAVSLIDAEAQLQTKMQEFLASSHAVELVDEVVALVLKNLPPALEPAEAETLPPAGELAEPEPPWEYVYDDRGIAIGTAPAAAAPLPPPDEAPPGLPEVPAT